MVHSGQRYTYPGFEEKLLGLPIEPGTSDLSRLLSEREFEVLRLIVTGKRLNDIALLLSLSNRTVSTYKRRIMNKINIKSDAELVKYALDQKIMN